jgi:adenylate cyclase
MATEIERKFLVHHSIWATVEKQNGKVFKQGYILREKNRTLRVRVTDDAAYITFKGAGNGISRSEYEYQVPVSEGIELLKGFATSVIEKTRYYISYAGKLWEVDVFSGDNSGLIVAEIELQHEDEPFEKPEWILDEVSHDSRYYNSSLSVNPYSSWHN